MRKVFCLLVLAATLVGCDGGGGGGVINVAGLWQMQLIVTSCNHPDFCDSGSPQYRWDQDRNLVVARNIASGFTLGGNIEGVNFTLDRIEGPVHTRWTGTVVGDTMSGSWSFAGGPYWSNGTLSGTRISAATANVAPIDEVGKGSKGAETTMLEMMLAE